MNVRSTELRNMLDSVRINFGEKSSENKKLWAEINSCDSVNTHSLRSIVHEHGWPGVSLVGKDGSRAAFLILQHSDKDTGIQMQMLPLLKKAAESNETEWQYFAFLTDRILVFKQGKKQIYGTQLKFNSQGLAEPFPIEDEENVDKRRKEVGLGKLNEYLELTNRLHLH